MGNYDILIEQIYDAMEQSRAGKDNKIIPLTFEGGTKIKRYLEDRFDIMRRYKYWTFSDEFKYRRDFVLYCMYSFMDVLLPNISCLYRIVIKSDNTLIEKGSFHFELHDEVELYDEFENMLKTHHKIPSDCTTYDGFKSFLIDKEYINQFYYALEIGYKTEYYWTTFHKFLTFRCLLKKL